MKIYESFNSKFNTYKNLEDKFNLMKSNFEKRERFNDYDPQKFMKNPKIEENFENRKYAMAEYRKSVHARSKSQVKSNANNNQVNYQQKFHQVSNLDESVSRKIPQNNKNDGFFFDDNAISDFNKIDNNFSNFNMKASKNNEMKSNIKNPLSNDMTRNNVKFQISDSKGLNPISIKENKMNKSANNSNFKINDDFNEIFGNIGSQNQINNISNFPMNNNYNNVFGNETNNFNKLNMNHNFNNGYEYNYEANVVQETQIDFGFNNFSNNSNNFDFFNKGQTFNNNQNNINFNQNQIFNNNIQANPGNNNQGKFILI
jgi:hypothetical protein